MTLCKIVVNVLQTTPDPINHSFCFGRGHAADARGRRKMLGLAEAKWPIEPWHTMLNQVKRFSAKFHGASRWT
jgi:hypothetical protein